MLEKSEKEIAAKWFAEMYDAEENETEDIECLLKLLGPKPLKILEVACGSGRILTALARAGHRVTGLDVDEEMLARIPGKAAGLTDITWQQADMLTADWGTGYDAVVIAGNLLLNIVTEMDYEKAQRLLIRKAREALVDGGTLYLDYNYTGHPEAWYADVQDFTVFEGTDRDGTAGRMQITRSTFQEDWIRCVRRFELTTAEGEKILLESLEEKHYIRLEQMHQWLAQEGFAAVQEYGSYQLEPIGENTGRAIILAHKTTEVSEDSDDIDLVLLTSSDPLWKKVRDYAESCSWSAGKSLAEDMDRGRFTDFERVIAAVKGEEICGYCTAARKDCIPDVPYTPYIGYVFVGEAHRGHRLSRRMIEYAAAYLRQLGFTTVYLVSDHENLYEKYGFAVIDRKLAPWGETEKIYQKQL